MLDRLQGEEMVRKELVTGLGTLITVRNFNVYQDPERYRVGACDGAVKGLVTIERRKRNPSTPNPTQEAAVQEVFDYWEKRRAEVLGKTTGPAMKATEKRLSKIRARLNEEYTPEQLREAVDGCLSNPFNVENGHLDIELICRDQAKVEQYRAWRARDEKVVPIERVASW